MIVLDSSAALEWLMRTSTGIRIRERALSGIVNINVPHLIDLEVAQVLRRMARQQKITATRAAEAWDDFYDLPLNRLPHTPFIHRVWTLCDNITAYDAIYIALAESLVAPLVTCDAKLASAPGHHAQVELMQDQN